MVIKFQQKNIKKGEFIFRYGQIKNFSYKYMQGEHVHSHNLSFSEFERNYKNDFDHQISNNINNELFFNGYKEKWCIRN